MWTNDYKGCQYSDNTCFRCQLAICRVCCHDCHWCCNYLKMSITLTYEEGTQALGTTHCNHFGKLLFKCSNKWWRNSLHKLNDAHIWVSNLSTTMFFEKGLLHAGSIFFTWPMNETTKMLSIFDWTTSPPPHQASYHWSFAWQNLRMKIKEDRGQLLWN